MTLLQVRRRAVLAPLILLLVVLFVWPVAMLLAGGFRSDPPFLDGRWTLEAWRAAFAAEGVRTAIWNSIKISAVTTAASTVVAAVLAFLSERTDLRVRRLILPSMVLVFVTPPLFYAVAFTLLANPYTGLVNDALRHGLGLSTPWLNAEGWGGILAVLTLKKSAITYLFLFGAFRALDATHDEAAYVSGAGPVRTFLQINIPSLAPAVTGAVLLGAATGLQVFEPVLILGAADRISVFSTLLLDLMNNVGKPDYARASVIATVAVGVVALLYLAQLRVLGRRDFVSVGGKGGSRRRLRLGKTNLLLSLAVGAYLTLAFLLPALALVVSSVQPYPGLYEGFSFGRYAEVLRFPRVADAVKVTLLLAVTVGGAAIVLSMLVAYASRGLDRPTRALVRFSTLIPLALPGVVAAVAVSWAYLSVPALRPLYGSLWLMGLALVVVVIPLTSQIADAAVAQIAPALGEAARVSGAGPARAFFEIGLVLVGPSLVAGWFMAAVLVGNNLEVPLLLKAPGTNTVSVVAYNIQGTGDFSQAAALLTLLAAGSFVFWFSGVLIIRLTRGFLARSRAAAPAGDGAVAGVPGAA